MKKVGIILLLALVAFSVGPASFGYAQGKVVRVSLIDENGSGEDGSAQLTDVGDGTTKVELIMMNAPEGADQPAHIHKGSCANLDATPVFALRDVEDNKSTTIVKVTLADLQKEKYAIKVSKSESETGVSVSCGNLPTAAASGATMTIDQVMSTLLDQATELQGTIQKKEADGSENAYTIYHATFAAHEDEIKAKDADAKGELDDAMTAVDTALKAGDWGKSSSAAAALVAKIKEIQGDMASASATTTRSNAAASMTQLQSAAADVQRETKNADPDGAEQAYNDFHTLFASIENDIKAKTPDGQAHIEAAMHEVGDAIDAKDFNKASTAAAELVNEVNDASNEMGVSISNLPNGGSPEFPLALAALAVGALAVMLAGTWFRRRATN